MLQHGPALHVTGERAGKATHPRAHATVVACSRAGRPMLFAVREWAPRMRVLLSGDAGEAGRLPGLPRLHRLLPVRPGMRIPGRARDRMDRGRTGPGEDPPRSGSGSETGCRPASRVEVLSAGRPTR